MPISYHIKYIPELNLAFFNPVQSGKYESFLFDIKTQKKTSIGAEHIILDISPDGNFIALSSKNYLYGNKNILTVKSIPENKVVYETKKHLVFQAFFSPKSDYLITTTYKNNGFCLNMGGDIVVEKFPFTTGGSAFTGNKVVFPTDRKKAIINVFDLDNLNFSSIPVESKGCIDQLRTDSNGNLYSIDTKFIVRKHNKDMELCWETRFPKDDHNFCNCAPPFFIKEEMDLLIYYASDHKHNYMGQRLSTGQKLTFRRNDDMTDGFIESVWPGNKVIDSLGGVFNIETGENSLLLPEEHK